MRTRKDVWKLAATDDTLYWYARAIAEMQKRPVTDPTSWRYQAAIHDYIAGEDPLAVPGETLPPTSEQDTFWARCQHGSWYFLPWHRGFLFYFEQILLTAIKKLGGPADWALPYWNYSDTSNAKARCLPPSFYAATLKELNPNPLLVTERAPGANTGLALGTAASAVITCLKKAAFTNSSTGGATGFGGGRTGFSHGGSVAGACESTPHNTMHVAVGGASGWMSAFNTAGLDPMFWLHHANIDRLWTVWRKGDKKHTDPTLNAWLNGITFDYHDASAKHVTLTCSQVVDTTKPILDYVYQDESDPFATPAPAVTPSTAVSMPERIPEMVGASEAGGVTLGMQPVAVQFALQQPSGPAARTTGASREVHLNLENITAARRPVESYMVFVGLPDGANPDDHPELMAGLLSSFGVVEASRRTREHAGDGVGYSYDITAIVSALEARNAWNPANVRVSFVPHRSDAERQAAIQTLPIHVGRVSLYYA